MHFFFIKRKPVDNAFYSLQLPASVRLHSISVCVENNYAYRRISHPHSLKRIDNSCWRYQRLCIIFLPSSYHFTHTYTHRYPQICKYFCCIRYKYRCHFHRFDKQRARYLPTSSSSDGALTHYLIAARLFSYWIWVNFTFFVCVVFEACVM